MRYAVCLQETAGFLVLHKQMGEAVAQVAEEPGAVPLEEILPGAEDGGEEVGGHVAPPQLLEVVEPEVVFHEERHRGAQHVEEPDGVGAGVGGQVAYKVGIRVVFAHLVARRGEEGDAYLVVRMCLAECFQNGARLLEFA